MFLEKFPYRVKFYTKQRVQRVQKVQRGRFLRLTGPMGRRVLKFDGAFGPEGGGGGSAADYKKTDPPPPVISTVAERSGEISRPK